MTEVTVTTDWDWDWVSDGAGVVCSSVVMGAAEEARGRAQRGTVPSKRGKKTFERSATASTATLDPTQPSSTPSIQHNGEEDEKGRRERECLAVGHPSSACRAHAPPIPMSSRFVHPSPPLQDPIKRHNRPQTELE